MTFVGPINLTFRERRGDVLAGNGAEIPTMFIRNNN